MFKRPLTIREYFLLIVIALGVLAFLLAIIFVRKHRENPAISEGTVSDPLVKKHCYVSFSTSS